MTYKRTYLQALNEPRMSINRCLIATLFFIAFSSQCVVAQRPTSLTGATKIDSAEEVVERWQPDRHLYVKGNIGVSQKLLDELEVWLDENGPNWTVVLMDNAADESCKINEINYSGADAVLQTLSKGLNNRTDFGNLKHSKTGETNGCVFALLLKQREFMYYGSEGAESSWTGNGSLEGQARSTSSSGNDGGRADWRRRQRYSSIHQRPNGPHDCQRGC